MEQHHRKQRQELESEMKVELERSKEELNQQLENELQAELEVSQTQQQLNDIQTPKQLPDSQLVDLQLNSVTHWLSNFSLTVVTILHVKTIQWQSNRTL